ncbi:MAG: ParB N-terminal domain-containing protein, partial [Bacilli bacterium]
MSETIKIKGKEYSIYETEISHKKLIFYKENPRIYSVINTEGCDPSQQEIEEQMCSLEHVRELKTSIMQYGGLAEPIYVRNGTFDVLEGNSRLAAYRLLNKMYPDGEWEYIKCKILPENIGEDAIRALLGTLHLVGRTDWSPFEQAGYLYRIKEKEDISDEELAIDLGLNKKDVTNSIKIYSLMKNVEDISPEHWSYYAEYSKSKSISKKRKLFPGLDNAFSEHVKGNRIKQAMDVRTEFSKVLTVNDKSTDKALKKFINGDYSIYDVKEEIESTGKTD